MLLNCVIRLLQSLKADLHKQIKKSLLTKNKTPNLDLRPNSTFYFLVFLTISTKYLKRNIQSCLVLPVTSDAILSLINI